MRLHARVHRSRDGAEIAYRVRSGRDPWVLLHGLGCDGSMWDGVVAALPEGLGLLIPDIRGHGGSTLGFGVPSVELWAGDVAALIGREGLVRPALAGLSMGGYTAMALAALAPSLARGYAFISTAATPDDDAGRARRAAGLATLQRSGWRRFAEEMVPLLIDERRPDFARNRDLLMGMFPRAGAAGLAAALFALAHRLDRRAALAAIRRPSVVVVGEEDRLTPPDRARAIAAAIPGARLIVLPGVAHMSALEAPGEVARALAGLDPARAAGGAAGGAAIRGGGAGPAPPSGPLPQ
ncbi:MAG: alpha/beta fold hydrolase [Acidobacteriota bacterium]